MDVRNSTETDGGVLPGAREIPLADLTEALDGLDRAEPLVVYCESGYRSQIAASVLAANGFTDVSDVVGGYTAWRHAGLPTDASRLPAPPSPSP